MGGTHCVQGIGGPRRKDISKIYADESIAIEGDRGQTHIQRTLLGEGGYCEEDLLLAARKSIKTDGGHLKRRV